MTPAEEDALVNEIFDKSWRAEPGAQTSLFNMAQSIRLAIRAAYAQGVSDAAVEADHWQKIGTPNHKCGEYIAGAIRGILK